LIVSRFGGTCTKLGIENPYTRRQLNLKIDRTSEEFDRIGVRDIRDIQRVEKGERLDSVEG
jgi:hypothetical protein